MLAELSCDWTFDVSRGPDWLFIKVGGPPNGDAEGFPLAETVWDMLQQHFARRVVLEMSEVPILRSYVVGQLVQLHKRINTHGGLMRIAGLSEDNFSVLLGCRLHERFPQYATCEDAVMGRRK
jgi:anti-anti-sigma regulatory factor